MTVVKYIVEFARKNAGFIAGYVVLLVLSIAVSLVGVTRATAAMYENVSKGMREPALKFLGIIAVLTAVVQGFSYGVDMLDNIMAPRFRQFAMNKATKEIFDANRMAYMDIIPMKYRAYLRATAQSSYQIFNSILRTYAPNAMLIFVLVCYLFYLDWRYGLIFALGIGALTLTFMANKNKVIENTRKVEIKLRNADILSYDVLSCLNTVVSKNTLEQEYQNIKRELQHATQANIKNNIAFDNLNYLMTCFIMALAFIVMYLSVDKLNPSAAVAPILTSLSLMATLQAKMSTLSTTNLNVVTEYGRFQANDLHTAVALGKLEGTLTLCSAEDEGRIPGVACSVFVDFIDVCFTYPGTHRQVLTNFTWQMKPGINVLRSHSGAGKTTIARILMRLYDIDSGAIYVNGKKIEDIQVDNLRKHFCFTNQDMGLLDRTVREVLAYGTDATDTETAAVWAQFADMFDGLTLDDPIGLQGGHMSTGQKQILRMGNVQLSATPFVIVDEPCSGLDPKHRSRVLEILGQMGASGKTLFIITHDADVTAIADNVKVIVPAGVDDDAEDISTLE